MNLTVLLILLAACAVLMLLEWRGVPTSLGLSFKGDVKRETRWLAQYGQTTCTLSAAALIWDLDPHGWRPAARVLITVFGTGLAAGLLKRLLGRVRPGREGAGRFVGPTLRHANWRESFPSSHSACAVALSVTLSILYPQGTAVFWTLALTCAALRYLLDAHWPSDVAGGIALGYAAAHLAWRAFEYRRPLGLGDP